MNKKELVEETLNFIKKYNRLPFMEEDVFEIEYLDDKESVKIRTLKASSNANKHFETNEKYVDYLFKKRKLTYKLISKCIDMSAIRVKNLLNKKNKNVTVDDRRKIYVFFNKDYYPEMDEYSSKCMKCKHNKKCGQNYWVDVKFCGKYKKK